MNGIHQKMRVSLMLLILGCLLAPADVFAQGIILPTAGPVNRGMGGASTAAPIESIGAIYWNPATISALPSSELSIGMDLLLSHSGISSSITGVGSGSTDSDPGISALPTIGWVHKVPNSNMTLGLGMYALAGFKTNYRASRGGENPLLEPQPGGFGSISSEAEFLQVAPVLSYSLSEKLSVSIGPTITMGKISASPFPFATPNADNGRYPAGYGGRVRWGGGAQLGLYYATDTCWSFGASIKSPQWMEEFRFKSEDGAGNPRSIGVKLDLPMILSLGGAYYGIDRTILALDVRYFDYKNTDGFKGSGFNADGSLQGLGWSNIFSIATGAQYEVSQGMFLRAGYQFNATPINSGDVSANLASPLLQQHLIHAGASMKLGTCVTAHVAATHIFNNELTGPIVTAGGIVPGSVSTSVSAQLVSMGLTVNY